MIPNFRNTLRTVSDGCAPLDNQLNARSSFTSIFGSGVNPARRELRLRLMRGRETALESPGRIRLVLPDGEAMVCKVMSARLEADRAIVVLAVGTTRDNVARMKGASAAVPSSGLTSGGAEMASISEVIGFEVRTTEGRVLGEITEAFETGANDVIEVANDRGGSILLPVIDDVIVSIDCDAGVVVVGDLAPYAVDDHENDLTRLV